MQKSSPHVFRRFLGQTGSTAVAAMSWNFGEAVELLRRFCHKHRAAIASGMLDMGIEAAEIAIAFRAAFA
jgi:hypothetical protein